MKEDHAIADALDIDLIPTQTSASNSQNPIVTQNVAVVPTVFTPSTVSNTINTDSADQKADYDKTRKAFNEILETGKKALIDLSTLAEETNSTRDAARCYEVMSGMIKSLTDATEKMYDIHEKKQKLTGTRNAPAVTNNIDKAVFVGTTEELVRSLRKDEQDEPI